jgi:ABC-type nitrate/sulfonate/bicarbonate transport system substrate-binding protein/outer membrane protein OmpA-like peptidoglycan-associated protein
MITFLALLTPLVLAQPASAVQKIQTVDAKPLARMVTPRLQPVAAGASTLYLITWGGDVATIHADSEGLFKAEGVQVKLACENDFTKQVQGVLDGKTPYLRGTMGMICSAAEAFQAAGTELVVVYQMTWSTGGDTLTVRAGISSADDLRGKTIGLQWPGPHADLIANYLTNAGLKPSEVRYRWFKELTLPTYDTGGSIVDAVSAFRNAKDIDGIMCISPDAFALTSGGSVGTGAEDSVKGAHVVFSTRTASRIIADVYAVRKDYLDQNRKQVESFVRALMKGEESLRDLRAAGPAEQARRSKLLARSAELLMGSPQATKDVEGMLSDCEFVGSSGNVAFFTGAGSTRTLEALTGEIEAAFVEMGLMSARVPLRAAGWDYPALTKGLKYAGVAAVSDPKFDTGKLQQGIEKQIAELESWEEGTLFVIEIGFKPNQSEFSESEYAAAYDKAFKIAQTYGGALVTIEGHSDPEGIRKARENGELPAKIAEKEQAAKNLSLQRAKKVQASFLQYCKKRNVVVDESQFAAVGLGVSRPKFAKPSTKEEWDANRRVVFRIKQVEAELEEFAPGK